MQKAVVTLTVSQFGIDKEATEKEIETLLEKAEFYGNFSGVVKKKVKGAQEAKKVVVGSFDLATKTVVIRSQLDGKGSNYQIALNIPEPYRQGIEEFFDKLKKVAHPEKSSRAPKKNRIARDKTNIDLEKAKKLFADEDLFNFVVVHLSEFFGSKENRETDEIISCLAELKLDCSSESILEFLISKGILSERQEVVVMRSEDRSEIGSVVSGAIEKLRQLEISSRDLNMLRKKIEAFGQEEVDLDQQLEKINQRRREIAAEKEALFLQIQAVEEEIQKIPKVMEVLGI